MKRSVAWLVFLFASALAVLCTAPVSAAPLSAVVDHPSAIGQSAEYLQEQAGPLTLTDAMAAYRAGEFTPGKTPVLSFGIGAKPVWIHVAVANPTATPVKRRLVIETAWLDHIDVHIQHQGKTDVTFLAGDSQEFAQRPVADRFFNFDYAFRTGVSDVFIRVETPDPMVIPLYLLSPKKSGIRQTQQELSYGAVYGFLLALMAYNAMLYASLRSTRYLLYAIYLAMFVAANMAYTGHGFAWIWPDSVNWQQWSNPVLMVLYGVSGLLFAAQFLELRTRFPRIHKGVIGFSLSFIALLVAAMLMGSQKYALLVAFTYVFLFAGVMLFLGAISLYAGQKPARYFLLAAVSAMVGALLTNLAVWGFIPNNSWTFRAVEIGMLLDATLLALALASQLRADQIERLQAERLAQLDPLTGLNNRRAFYDKTIPLWSQSIRHGHDTVVMLLDIDFFKRVNDSQGHAHGDKVLKVMAVILQQSIRQGDVLARWGGEEFIVFLPETSLQEAAALAERLRISIALMRIPHKSGETAVTASFGVAQKEAHHLTLDALIAAADASLYQSKQQGRNRVTGNLIEQQ